MYPGSLPATILDPQEETDNSGLLLIDQVQWRHRICQFEETGRHPTAHLLGYNHQVSGELYPLPQCQICGFGLFVLLSQPIGILLQRRHRSAAVADYMLRA